MSTNDTKLKAEAFKCVLRAYNIQFMY